jgi:hypothetical protein
VIEFLSTVPHCALYGKPIQVTLHLFGDLLTGTAYMAIPVVIEIVRRQKGLPFNRLALCFALFIALCGTGHFINVVTMLTGTAWSYWWRGINDALTGIVSWATAIYSIRLIPMLLRLPTLAEWETERKVLDDYRDAERWRLLGKPGDTVGGWE